MSLTRVGGDLLKQPLNIGTGVTITPDGNATFSGIVTAANLVGSDGKPIASGAGLGTAVVAGSDEGGEQIYYTNTVLNITDNLTIDPPDSANASYTQYQEVAVEQGKDLIVEDDFIVDVLGISSSVATPLPGQGGRVRADRFTNKAGTGAPTFPNGIEVTTDATVGGALTVTSNLTVDGNLVVNGSETSLKTTKLQVDDINIGIAPFDNKLSDGQLNGAGFTIHGLNGDKSLTWDNPNDRMAFSTDLYAPNVTADGSITVGDTFLKPKSIGIGTISTTERNAGINTAIGTLIYNATTDSIQSYGPQGWKNVKALVDSGHIATGGLINDVQSGSTYYRSHIFTSSGTFDITQLGTFGETIEVLVAGGGGGGGGTTTGPGAGAGGGGGGGLKYDSAFPVSVSSYPVTIGAGGLGGAKYTSTGGPGTKGSNGGDTVFDSITSAGGGGGGGDRGPVAAGLPGGSGGGAGWGQDAPYAGGTGSGDIGGTSDSISPTNGWGNDGGDNGGGSSSGAGGGGGASASGGQGPNGDYSGGPGGAGLNYTISGLSNFYYCGGGGAGAYSSGTPGSGGSGGGANGGAASGNGTGGNGTHAYGGGGGGGSRVSNTAYNGGNGGSGTVVIRYQISTDQTSTAKATGGYVSFYNGKTIHTFNYSGTFTTPASFNETCEYVMIGGGGSGGCYTYRGGGGGAGTYKTGSTTVSGPNSINVTVGSGGASFVTGAPSPVGNGNASSIAFPGTITAPGGGMGGSWPNIGGHAGGSGGGAGGGPGTPGSNGGGSTGDPYPGTIGVTPPNGWGHDGGHTDVNHQQGAGGGGAGQVGYPNGPAANTPTRGLGGSGVQMPATFRNPQIPVGTPGPNPGGYYVGGGGNGGGYPTGVNPVVATTQPVGGGGYGIVDTSVPPYGGAGGNGIINTGSGGGGTSYGEVPSPAQGDGIGGNGGAGIVLIAYPT